MNYNEALKTNARSPRPQSVITLEAYGSLKEEDPVKISSGGDVGDSGALHREDFRGG